MKERPRFYTTVLTDHLKKYPSDGSGSRVRKRLSFSVRLQPVPERSCHQCGHHRRHWLLSGAGYRAPSLCNPVAQ
jgi:hypothetical protein